MDDESDERINRRIWLGIDQCIITCHAAAKSRGWWTKLYTVEVYRQSTDDKNCPEFTALEIELADMLIRIFDLAGALQLRLGDALTTKLIYNRNRHEQSIE